MRLISLFPIALLTALVRSGPIRRNPAADVRVFNATCDRSSEGAIYFLTNEQSGNYVVSACIGQDGLLTAARATSAQGVGSRGNSTGNDPIYSQGPVSVSQKAGLLAAVNVGSNTVQLFKIDPTSPSILYPIGEPAPSGGKFPTSVTFNSAGDVLCVINGAESAGVRCFVVNQQFGLIPGSTRLLPLNNTFPPNGPFGTVSTVIFTPDDKQVVAAVKSPVRNDPNNLPYLATWTLESAWSATLSETTFTTLTGSLGTPFSLSYVPGRDAFFSADLGIDVIDYSRGFGTANVVTKALNVTGQIAVCWSIYSTVSQNYYVTDVGTGLVSEIAVSEDLTPSLVKQYLPPGPKSADEVTIMTINGKDYVYALLPSVKGAGVMEVSGPGNASFVQTLDFSVPAQAAGIPIDAAQLAGMASYKKNQYWAWA